jgi:hypothetical protein
LIVDTDRSRRAMILTQDTIQTDTGVSRDEKRAQHPFLSRQVGRIANHFVAKGFFQFTDRQGCFWTADGCCDGQVG